VTVLNPAIAPAEASFPKLPLILALAVAVGTLLGMVFALAAEMIDRRVRGVEDLVEVGGVQLWGVLDDTASIARDVERRKRVFMKRPRILPPMQEPTLE
jgi:capsular polysaccharide biosynthesis protein